MNKFVLLFSLSIAAQYSGSGLANEDDANQNSPKREVEIDLADPQQNFNIQFDRQTDLSLKIMSIAPKKVHTYRVKSKEIFIGPSNGLTDVRQEREQTQPADAAENADTAVEQKREERRVLEEDRKSMDDDRKVLESTNSKSISDRDRFRSSLQTKALNIQEKMRAEELDSLIDTSFRQIELLDTAIENIDIAIENIDAEIALLTLCGEKYSELLGANSEQDIPSILSELKMLTANEECKSIYEKALSETKFTINKTLSTDKVYELEFTDGNQTLASFSAEPKPEWIAHVGFVFIDNDDERFFSKEIKSDVDGMETTTYQITASSDRDDYKYAAMGMYTYPFANLTNDRDWQLGFTAALGTDSSNIAVGVGVSLVVYKNVMISFLAVGTEFDVLKGQYKVGQDIGESQIASADLVDQTFKFSPSIAISFKFGS